MKKIAILILIFISIVACNDRSVTEIPVITIQSSDINIDYVVGLNSWDGTDHNREDNFKVIMRNAFESLPYIKLGSEISIEFDEKMLPDTIELYDYVLDRNGNAKYTSREVMKRLFNLENGKGSFILDRHFAAMLSSHSKDYEPGASIRGFKLIARWGKNECEYAFIIRSDAH